MGGRQGQVVFFFLASAQSITTTCKLQVSASSMSPCQAVSRPWGLPSQLCPGLPGVQAEVPVLVQRAGRHAQGLESHVLWEEEPVGDETGGDLLRGSPAHSPTNTDVKTSNPASTSARLHSRPSLHPLPSRHEDQPDRTELPRRDQASSTSNQRRLGVRSSGKASISKSSDILAGIASCKAIS